MYQQFKKPATKKSILTVLYSRSLKTQQCQSWLHTQASINGNHDKYSVKKKSNHSTHVTYTMSYQWLIETAIEELAWAPNEWSHAFPWGVWELVKKEGRLVTDHHCEDVCDPQSVQPLWCCSVNWIKLYRAAV